MSGKSLEIERWLKIAENDLATARLLVVHGIYTNAIFACQQAVEKALKGLYIAEVNEMFPKTHSLAQIAESTSFPTSQFGFLRELTTKYTESRYPAFLTEDPADLYDREYAEVLLAKTEQAVQWIKKRLNEI
ncbi:HEPN domain-containing protein [bacterium]|nr:HEPN domain-containing protein [bacterium]RQV98480.1 MAG: HEPN domain-containing protein [bacterium]